MSKRFLILTLFLLCAVSIKVEGNTENADEAKTPEPAPTQQTEAAPDSTVHVANVSGTEGAHQEQHAAAIKEPLNDTQTDSGGESEDRSIDDTDSSGLNDTMKDRYNNTNRPQFRRYVDLRKHLPIVEGRDGNNWVRIRPPMQPGEVHETNITRYRYFPNGTKSLLRSKFDYSYDDIHWFRSSRIKVPVQQYSNGSTRFQYRFGPKTWIGPNRNAIFESPNATKMFYSQLTPAPTNQQATEQKQANRNDPAAQRNFGPGIPRRRYWGDGGRRYYNRWYGYNNYPPAAYRPLDNRGWPVQNRYYGGYYGYRPSYNYPPNDPYYYNSRQSYGGPPYDRSRYGPSGSAPSDPRYGGSYGPEKYPYSNGYGPYADGRYPQPEARKYQTASVNDDKPYYPSEAAYNDRKYPSESAPSNQRSQVYDTRRQSDQAPRYEERSYDERSYDERSYGPRRGDRRKRDTNGVNGGKYEEHRGRYAYLDPENIPEGKAEQEEYFKEEYREILAEALKYLWRLHRDMRTLRPAYEALKRDGTITDLTDFVPMVNGSLWLIDYLANRIDFRRESPITIEEFMQPIERGPAARSFNNIEKMITILQAYKKPSVPNEKLENLMKKLIKLREQLKTVQTDITHMVTVLRRTLKMYGFFVIGSGY